MPGKKKGGKKPNIKGGSPGTVYKPADWEKEIIGKPTDKTPLAKSPFNGKGTNNVNA